MRILIFGDGLWAANSLLGLKQSGFEIVTAVVRWNPSDATFADAAHSLELPILQPVRVNEPEFAERIKQTGADLGISISFNQILRRPILDSTRLGFVNFHAGKLPQYRGRNVINWAIINGEEEIGLTAHFVDEGIDTGDIIVQRTLPIHWTDTYGDVLNRVVESFPAFVLETVKRVASGDICTQQQSHLPGTYFPGREEGDEWLDWSDTSYNLYNKVRAITRPGPGAHTLLGDQMVTIWRSYYDPSWPKYIATPGQVVGRGSDGVLVKTGDSTLLVHEVQFAEGEPMLPSWAIGTRLGVDLIHSLQSLLVRVKALETNNPSR